MDNAPYKRVPFLGGTWWRFSSYRLDRACIRPAIGAKLVQYDPWRFLGQKPSPYTSLLQMHKSLRFSFTGELDSRSSANLLSWCSEYGLLGILPHVTVSASLALRWKRLGDVLIPLKSVYRRQGSSWTTDQDRITMDRQPYNVKALNKLYSNRKVIEQERRGRAVIHGLQYDHSSPSYKIEPLKEAWGRFFPDVTVSEQDTFEYPIPTSDEFWKSYAEPLHDFLSVVQYLEQGLEAINSLTKPAGSSYEDRQSRILNLLVEPVSPAITHTNQRFQIRWDSPSLLGALAIMAILDLTEPGAKILACPVCGIPFASKSYQAMYCSHRCRQTAQKRAQRLRRRHGKKRGSDEETRSE